MTEFLFEYSEEKFLQLEEDIQKLKDENQKLDEQIKSYKDLVNEIKIYENELNTMKIKDTSSLESSIKILRERYTFEIRALRCLEVEAKKIQDTTSKYSENRGILSLLSKSDRKKYHQYTDCLKQLFDLETKYKITLEENEKIKNNKVTFQKEKLRPLYQQEDKLSKQYKKNLEEKKKNKNTLSILNLEMSNQLIVKKYLPYAQSNNILVNKEDDDKDEDYYEDNKNDYQSLKNKCIHHYANTLVYLGNMSPLCDNVDCDGIILGNSCNCGKNKNIWFTTLCPQEYESYIVVKDTVFFPESDNPLGYLIEKEYSIKEYIEYAEENDIKYNNYDEMIIKCNIFHYNFLSGSYVIFSDEYPDNGYDHDEGCCFRVWENGRCECGKGSFVFEYDEFNPRDYDIKVERLNGYLRNA